MEENTPCFECGNQVVYNHHVIPVAKGGKKTVPLCADCHGIVHGIFFTMHHPTLIRQGIERAKARGHKWGRRFKLSPEQQRQAAHLKQGGMPITEIAKTLQCSRHTVYKSLAQAQPTQLAEAAD
jgi:DNA-binding CsgD family transcriptional regulator